MKHPVRLLCLALVGVLLGAGTLALARTAGRRYEGFSRGGAPVAIQVSPNGKTVSLRVNFRSGRCTGGATFSSGVISSGERVRDRSFSTEATDVKGTYRGRHGRFTLAVSGRFSAAGDVVRGTVTGSFSSGRFTCRSGSVPFSAVPLRNANVSSGDYRASGRGLSDVGLRVYVPSRRVVRLSFGWVSGCDRGARLRGAEDFSDLGLRATRFGLRGQSTVKLDRNTVSYDSYQLDGRFYRSGGVYRVRGTWSVTSTVRRRGAKPLHCSSGVLAFSGRHS